MDNKNLGLMAHLMRRAGFGATYEELGSRAAKGYEATVEELLNPDAYGVPPVDTNMFYRYHPLAEAEASTEKSALTFMYFLVTSRRSLEEKMALFWHMVFATGNSKVENSREMVRQIDTFRRYGMGNYRDLLIRLAKDPAMIFWLDNNQNHKKAPNENWGRELLELFSMGQGHYTEDDVKMAARAFTGWTIKPKLPKDPYLCLDTWEFQYRPEDHDDSEKMFLGRKGRFNGEDIINIILEGPATAQFIARHLYNFFVKDDVQVPSWKDEPPRDPKAVQAIADVLVKNDFEIKPTLRFLFNSEFFKDEKVRFAKVKSPAEVVVGTARLTGEFQQMKPGFMRLTLESDYQGQMLTDPPSVEGWHTGQEWITTGSLIRRINFMASKFADLQLPGVRSIIDRLGTKETLSPEELVDGCLELLGAIRLNSGTRRELIEQAKTGGVIRRGHSEQETKAFANKVSEILQLVAATREYQCC